MTSEALTTNLNSEPELNPGTPQDENIRGFVGTHNPVRARLNSGEPALGLFLLSGSSQVAELLSTLSIDWLVVDMEASPISPREVIQVFQALHNTRVAPLVRVPVNSHHLIEQALDWGAHGVLVPKVDDADAARLVAAAARYPPHGRRGVNPVRASAYFADVGAYLSNANARTLCMVQVESVRAVENARAIAGVDGIDLLFIGAGDLAYSLGQPGQVTGPQMDTARRRVIDACLEHHKIPGIFAYSLELAEQYLVEGFRFVAFGNDYKLLREAASGSLRRLRGAGV